VETNRIMNKYPTIIDTRNIEIELNNIRICREISYGSGFNRWSCDCCKRKMERIERKMNAGGIKWIIDWITNASKIPNSN